MKKGLLACLGLMLVCGMVFMGCDLSSKDEPADDPGVSIDEDVVGTWLNTSGTYRISKGTTPRRANVYPYFPW